MRRFLASTIGSKLILGLAGLGLSAFVLTHMLGNLLIFWGPETYNRYSHALVSNPLIEVAEIGLVAIFLLHIIFAILLTLRNRKARPENYVAVAKGEKATSFIEKTLIHQGVVIFVFVILHIVTVKYGSNYTVTYGADSMRDLYRLLEEWFQNFYYMGFYIVAVGVLGLHLGNGLRSSLQTLGFYHPQSQPFVKKLSQLFGLIVTLGFISTPIYMYIYL